jgi:hypothetical protein
MAEKRRLGPLVTAERIKSNFETYKTPVEIGYKVVQFVLTWPNGKVQVRCEGEDYLISASEWEFAKPW